MRFQDFDWRVALAARRVPRQRTQEARDGVGDAAVPGHVGIAHVAPTREDDRRHSKQRRRRLAAIAFELAHAGHGIVVKIEGSGVDKIGQRLARQMANPLRVQNRSRHGMRGDVAPALAFENIAPPLKADFARHRVGHDVANPRDVQTEGVKRVQVPPRVRRREQAREPTVPVAVAQELFAMDVGFAQPWVWNIVDQAVAKNAPATRRRSPSRILYVETADPVAMKSQRIPESRSLARNSAGSGAGLAPVPTISSSTAPAGSAKSAARDCGSASEIVRAAQA